MTPPFSFEMHDATDVDIGEQPLVAGHAARHAAPEGRHGHRHVVRGRPRASEPQPIAAARPAIYIVGIAGRVGDNDLGRSLFWAFQPVAAHPATPGFREQKRLVVVRHADAIGEEKITKDRPGDAGCGIVSDNPAVSAALQGVDHPFLEPVANCGLAEIDFAIGRDVEIVCKAHAGIIDDREPRAVGLRGYFLDLAKTVDAIETHAAYAHDEAAILVEGHAEWPAADMRIDFALHVVGSEEANDFSLPHAAIKVRVLVENDVLWTVNLA